ncbi:GNAT family N-acetyltransferase [Christiangramia portivictoriae]|uniref:GNAT family N-acetyltransferase n=1 Tax=Christiangramia portivictoriae TaxID=326069 RepID=UPI0003F50830|nr:GNAT family N-acetyltransferase [Christiangramia portivictoriae]
MKILIANKSHASYAEIICNTIEESAKVRGTGIARRTPEYIINKMEKGNAVIALEEENFAGFCYIETWSHDKYVANSGLIVHPDYRNQGLAKDIKNVIFDHSRKKYPEAKIFGITTGLAVMKINYDLGYQPVTFSELTDDETFWKGCQTCKNYDILTRTDHKMCLCTGMLYDPAKKKDLKLKEKPKTNFNEKAFQRLKSIKQTLFYKKEKK